jgi:hypothetical protein
MSQRLVLNGRGDAIDRFGMLASTLCAAHCALCALLPALLGTLGLGVLSSHEAEWGFTLVAVVLALGALWLGYRRHRSGRIAVVFGVGIVALVLSRFIEAFAGHSAGAAVGILAGLTLVWGHISSIRAARCQMCP